MTESRPKTAACILAVLLLLGTAARLRQYLARTSFWGDEACLILNFRSHPPLELLHRLDHHQAAPPLFLWAEQALYRGFGVNELALRSPAFAGGIVALGLFALLARRLFPPPIALFAVGWFALCPRLITHAAELKQYSTDVMVATLLLLVVFGIWRPRSPVRRLALLSCVAACTLWLSHPTIILWAALGMALLFECARNGRRSLAAGLLWCAPVAASFVILYVVSIRHQHDPHLFDFWAKGFPDWSRPWGIFPWLVSRTYDLFNLPFRVPGLLLLPLCLAGVIRLRTTKRDALLIGLAMPTVLLVVAAMLRQYPFTGTRLSLFLFPTFFLLAGFGVEWLRDAAPEPWRRAWWVSAAIVVAGGVYEAASLAWHPEYLSHVRPVVAYVQSHLEPEEVIYVVGEVRVGEPMFIEGSAPEFFAYWPKPPMPVYTNLRSVDQIRARRFWVVFACGPNPLKRTLGVFDEMKKVADPQGPPFVVKEGGAACLFVLRRPAKESTSAPLTEPASSSPRCSDD